MSNRQDGFGLAGCLIVLVVLAAIGFAAWHVWSPKDKNPAATETTSSVATTDPYAGWKTYTSSFEKLSFKYPASWTTKDISKHYSMPGTDAFQLTSPSAKLSIYWFSAIDGIGGACDASAAPGTVVSPTQLGPCPYWYVLHKQRLKGADLFYVDGIETSDGKTYSPWCALQASDGLLESKGYIGYQLFKGKSNYYEASGHKLGRLLAGLKCGVSYGDFGSQGLIKGTKSEATAYLSTSEMKQAKLVLLSASY